MKKLIGLMLAVMMLAALSSVAMAEDNGRTMYVFTQNGKPVNIRTTMSTEEDNVVGSLPYGASIVTFGSPKPGWTYVQYGTSGDHYVMSRYLVKEKPEPYTPSPDPKPKSKDFDTRSATTVEQMNKLLVSAKSVEPYSVTVRPTRTSGWVYLRWLPSKNAKQIATYGANEELTVIAELRDWYQVQDATGKVGFVYKDYIH